MRAITYVCLALALAIPSVVYAGQVYGTIVMDGKGVGGANVEISCGSDPALKAATAADGSYRINVPPQGQCNLTLPSYEGRPPPRSSRAPTRLPTTTSWSSLRTGSTS